MKYSDFSQITRCVSGLGDDLGAEEYAEKARELAARIDVPEKPIRLLGLSLSKSSKTDARTGNPLQLLLDFDE